MLPHWQRMLMGQLTQSRIPLLQTPVKMVMDAAFKVHTTTGVVTVNDNAALNYEAAQSCTITVRATSTDSSTADTTFTIAVT